ncbi:MAG: LysR family transcriptional regulator [Clostridia bacterium]|nr:LysR family transcriptional regulator [Clostridia bacterium]
MNSNELNYFLTIAREGSLTTAAEKLFITQPTLTKYIQRLEKDVGLTLFRRVGKKLMLTYAGERYKSYAEKLVQLQLDMDLEMNDLRENGVTRLRVGIPPFRCSYVLPWVLPEFKKLHPNVRFELIEDASASLDKALLQGDIDLAIYNLFEPLPQLDYTLLEHDRFYAVLPQGHPVKDKAVYPEDGGPGEIPLELLQDEIFIIQSRKQRSGQFIHQQMKNINFTPKRILESSNIRAAGLLAANGYGVSFMCASLLRRFQGASRCDVYRIADCDMALDLVAASRKDAYLPVCARDFIELVRECNLRSPD